MAPFRLLSKVAFSVPSPNHFFFSATSTSVPGKNNRIPPRPSAELFLMIQWGLLTGAGEAGSEGLPHLHPSGTVP